MHTKDADTARAIPIPPPLLYAAPLALGLRLRKKLPGVPLPRPLRRLAGLLLLGSGILLSAWFVRTMLQAQTTFNPRRPATTLVTRGPFQFTRNPGYLGMTAIYSGVALLANALPALLLLPLVLLIMSRRVIQPEEQYLERRFGKSYRVYKTRVRRWV
jgi:protein-S-isoprenylcysteine O-methyltransferase Ste14